MLHPAIRRALVALTAGLLAASTAVPAAAAPGQGNVLRHRAPAPVIEEDDPRWECWRMGNRACGATVLDPRSGAEIAVVVQYDRRGRIASVRLG